MATARWVTDPATGQVSSVLNILSKTAAVLGSAVGCKVIAEKDALAVLQFNVARAAEIGTNLAPAELDAIDAEYDRQRAMATGAYGCEGWLKHPEIARQVRQAVMIVRGAGSNPH
jgi:hypothetical protein